MSRGLRCGSWIVIVLVLAGAAPLPKVQSMMARPEVLCGRFEQRKQLVGLKTPVTSSGRFCVLATKGILWRTLKPFPSTIRLTHDEIVQFHEERVALRLEARREPSVRLINGVLLGLLAGDLSHLEKTFRIDAAVHSNGWTVTLEPRDAGFATVFRRISLKGGAYVTSLEMEEAAGDRTGIAFSAIETGEGAMNPDEAKLF